MKNNIIATHLEWNFSSKMSSFWTPYLKLQKWNWVVVGDYWKLEKRSSTFMNKSWSETTWNKGKIEPKVADTDLPGQLDICVVIWKPLELYKCIWDDPSFCGKIREISTSFMKKLWANMSCSLDEIEDEDKYVIPSSQYNTFAMLERFYMSKLHETSAWMFRIEYSTTLMRTTKASLAIQRVKEIKKSSKHNMLQQAHTKLFRIQVCHAIR